MENFFASDTPHEASGSTSTAVVDADDAILNGRGDGQSAGGQQIPMESESSISVQHSMQDGNDRSNLHSGHAEDPRFRLGIESGRWFSGSSGEVYELLDSIGSGSASTVYKCRKVRANEVPRTSDSPIQPKNCCNQHREDDVLAVKAIDLKGLRLNRNFDQEMEKLRREAQYLRTLRHPCIVRFIDYVETSDAIFIVQEYLKGGELFYKIVEKGCLSEQQACFIAHQMLAAIVFMHNSKVIHRDIKPENILIHDEVEDGFFRVKMADFGLAKTLARYSLATTMVGTPQYWAPEVINCGSGNVSGSYSYKADLWSFGVCLYVFLGGTYPFDSATGPIQQLVLNGRFHFRHSRFSRVSDDAKDLIRRTLVVDQNRRITEKEIFFHPWMTRWLCDIDRSRFRISNEGSTAFRFMPPLPSLASPGAPYPPCDWQLLNKQESDRPSGNRGLNSLALDPAAVKETGPLGSAGRMSEDQSSSRAVELRADLNDDAGAAVGTMLPGFVKTKEPIPPFHLPILLPLQLHLLLSVHLLLLSLRESQSSFLLAQKLQKELWSLQRCVHTAVGFFEVTATSAIEAVIDIASMFEGDERVGDSSGAMDAVAELFGQVRRWTCEMQKQGERLGVRYGHAEQSVSELICCLVGALSAADPNSEPQAKEKQSQSPLPKTDVTPGAEAALTDGGKPTNPKEEPVVSEPVNVKESIDKNNRALVSPVSASPDKGGTLEPGPAENGVGSWGAGGSAARMDLLREFLASNIRRMLYSFAQSSREESNREGSSPVMDDRQQVDAGVQAWSQVGLPDPSAVTEEILDFMFLSTKTAASHARQLAQPTGTPGECLSVGTADAASRGSSASGISYAPPDDTTSFGDPSHCLSDPGGRRGLESSSESLPLGAEGAKANAGNTPPSELSFLCESGSPTSSANNALHEQIAVSRLQLRSLEKLRQISYVLTCVCSFWSNFDIILCRLLQLQQITEALTKHARASWVNKRAYKRLGHLKDCWIKFRTQCRIYLQLSNARNAKLMDLGLHVQMRADQLDAIRALRGVPGEQHYL